MTTVSENDTSDVKITDRINLKDKNFLITGGGRGIGFACAKAIAQLGGGVAVVDTLAEPVEEFQTLSERFGIKMSYVRGDVTSQESLEEAFAQSVRAMGQLHGGLLAAGICIDEPLLEADWEHSQRTFNVNVLGTFWTIKLLGKHLVETGTRGSIVTIASLNGQGVYVPVQPCAAYNASKAAVKGMMGPIGAELGEYGIRTNSISPGAIQTPLLKRLEGEKRAILDFYREGAPLQRLGVPEDLTPMVCYLLSDAASFVTGADFLMTGGLHAGSVRK
ncbi:hypothetical protein LTS08_006398 [Lithohypha guttulata]|nr:hypothetical protein LTS08_006398 [Lithohypha guttulata]